MSRSSIQTTKATARWACRVWVLNGPAVFRRERTVLTLPQWHSGGDESSAQVPSHQSLSSALLQSPAGVPRYCTEDLWLWNCVWHSDLHDQQQRQRSVDGTRGLWRYCSLVPVNHECWRGAEIGTDTTVHCHCQYTVHAVWMDPLQAAGNTNLSIYPFICCSMYLSCYLLYLSIAPSIFLSPSCRWMKALFQTCVSKTNLKKISKKNKRATEMSQEPGEIIWHNMLFNPGPHSNHTCLFPVQPVFFCSCVSTNSEPAAKMWKSIQ